MAASENQRALEPGIELDLRNRTTYGGYLQLDQLLSAQKPLSDPGSADLLIAMPAIIFPLTLSAGDP